MKNLLIRLIPIGFILSFYNVDPVHGQAEWGDLRARDGGLCSAVMQLQLSQNCMAGIVVPRGDGSDICKTGNYPGGVGQNDYIDDCRKALSVQNSRIKSPAQTAVKAVQQAARGNRQPVAPSSTPGKRVASLPTVCLVRNKPGWAHNACSTKANVTYCHLNGAFMCNKQSFGSFTMAPYGDTGTAANGAIAYVICPYPASARNLRFANGKLTFDGCY